MVVFSHSRLSSYENCPAQYRYRYIEKIETPYEGVEAFMGKRVHEVLERLYHHVARHGKPPSLSQVLSRFERDWRFHWHPNVRIVRTENPPEFYMGQGSRCLENYYRSHYPFDTEETVGLEQAVTLALDEAGRYRMRGIIDRLVRTGEGRYEVHDYKTSGSMPPRRRLEQDRQLPLYQIAVQQAYPDASEVSLVWHYLAFNRTVRQSRSDDQLAELRTQTIELIDRVSCATEFPARTGPLCRWCDYGEICPAFGDSGQARGEADAPGPQLGAADPSFAADPSLDGDGIGDASQDPLGEPDSEAETGGTGESAAVRAPAKVLPRKGQLSLL